MALSFHEIGHGMLETQKRGEFPVSSRRNTAYSNDFVRSESGQRQDEDSRRKRTSRSLQDSMAHTSGCLSSRLPAMSSANLSTVPALTEGSCRGAAKAQRA